MAKTFTADLTSSALAICRVCSILCKDGTTILLTDARDDVVVGSDTYVATRGVQVSDISYSGDGQPDTTDISAVLSAAGPFKEDDVSLGRFRSAVVGIRRADAAGGSVSDWLFTGIIGDQTFSPDRTQIVFEVRSDVLGKSILCGFFGALCRADFGDYISPDDPGLCKLPVKPDDVIRVHAYLVGDYYRVQTGLASDPTDYANRRYRVTTAGTTHAVQPIYDTVVGHSTTDGSVVAIAEEALLRTVTVATVAANGMSFTISDPADVRAVDGYFALGWFAVNGNYEVSYEVRAFVLSTLTIKTWLPVTELLIVGDIIDLSPGCDKRKDETCGPRFDNVVNNRSEA